MIDRRTFGIGVASSFGMGTRLWAQPVEPAGKLGYLHPVAIDPSHVPFALLSPARRRAAIGAGDRLSEKSAFMSMRY
jgi:hypothetical protein